MNKKIGVYDKVIMKLQNFMFRKKKLSTFGSQRENIFPDILLFHAQRKVSGICSATAILCCTWQHMVNLAMQLSKNRQHMILLAKSDHLEEMPDRIAPKKVSNSPSSYLSFQCYHSPIYINKLWFSGLRDIYADSVVEVSQKKY